MYFQCFGLSRIMEENSGVSSFPLKDKNQLGVLSWTWYANRGFREIGRQSSLGTFSMPLEIRIQVARTGVMPGAGTGNWWHTLCVGPTVYSRQRKIKTEPMDPLWGAVNPHHGENLGAKNGWFSEIVTGNSSPQGHKQTNTHPLSSMERGVRASPSTGSCWPEQKAFSG